MIVERIREEVKSGQIIPKPRTRTNIVKKWGKRANEPALIYLIPSRTKGKKPNEKGITVSEFEQAYLQLVGTGSLTRDWFNRTLTRCSTEGGCNFTTIGGIFILLGEAKYSGHGVYDHL